MSYSDDKFILISKMKNFIIESEVLFHNIPRRDLYNRDSLRKDMTEILRLMYLANNIRDDKQLKNKFGLKNNLNVTELATSSFGQSFTVNMVQMASAFASLINGGTYYEPHIVKAIKNAEGATIQKIEPIEVSKTISIETSELLSELIYCYTPKGDVLELPKGATPVDFAYRIHSGVGDRTIGAIVNDQIVPLDYELQDGDIVKINTGKESNPNKDWLNFVKSSQAKSKIKSFFSKQDRTNYINTGKEMLEKEIRRKKLSFSDVLTDENLEKVFKDTHTTDLEDLYLSIGSLRYTAGYIVDLLFEDKKDVMDIYLSKITNRSTLSNKAIKGDIIVAGTDDILVTIASCCKPVKGDDIIGYITKGEGIAVHKKDCQNIKSSTRLIDVEWNMDSEASYLTDLIIKVIKGKNQLLDIITKASQKDVYIESVKTIEDVDSTTFAVTIKTTNSSQLEMFISDLKSLPFLISVERKSK